MPEAGAAVVAAQLVAFAREPVRYRLRFTQGREPFPGGLHVFRFAQGRFPNTLLRDLSREERERVREAAAFFIRQVCFWDSASHYQVLCVAPDSKRDTIKEHYHVLMALIHPDRPEKSPQAWPAEAAQRANRAYAILGDEARRSAYDQGLDGAPMAAAGLDEVLAASPAFATPRHPGVRSAAHRRRYLRPMLVVTAVLATLFFFQVWWAAEIPREYLALQSAAAPFEVSSRWMRDVLSADRPHFLGAKAAAGTNTAAPESEGAAAEGTLVTPLWRLLASRASEKRVVPDVPRKPASPTALAPAERVPIELPRPAAPLLKSEPSLRPAAAAQSSVREPPPAAPPVKDPAGASLTTDEIETLVALVVTYYEAGDVDRLLSLYDASSVSVWEAMRLRGDFEQFFRNTKSRRLRLTRVAWDASGTVARAKGEARLVVEYFDDPQPVERSVKLEIEVAEREGVPRITRLALFPHGN